jgi:hypothetical protein
VPTGETADDGDIGVLAAEIFADSRPPETVRVLMGTEDGFDRAMWHRWASETGSQLLGSAAAQWARITAHLEQAF